MDEAGGEKTNIRVDEAGGEKANIRVDEDGGEKASYMANNYQPVYQTLESDL